MSKLMGLLKCGVAVVTFMPWVRGKQQAESQRLFGQRKGKSSSGDLFIDPTKQRSVLAQKGALVHRTANSSLRARPVVISLTHTTRNDGDDKRYCYIFSARKREDSIG
jgi:hypothetical protein